MFLLDAYLNAHYSKNKTQESQRQLENFSKYVYSIT